MITHTPRGRGIVAGNAHAVKPSYTGDSHISSRICRGPPRWERACEAYTSRLRIIAATGSGSFPVEIQQGASRGCAPQKRVPGFRPSPASPGLAHPNQAGKGQVQSGRRGCFGGGRPLRTSPVGLRWARETSTILDTLPRLRGCIQNPWKSHAILPPKKMHDPDLIKKADRV